MFNEIYQFFKSLCDRMGSAISSLRRTNAVPPATPIQQTEDAASLAEIELNDTLQTEIVNVIKDTFMEEEPELIEIEKNNEHSNEEVEENEVSGEETESQEDNDHSSDEDYVYEEDHDEDEYDETDDDDE